MLQVGTLVICLNMYVGIGEVDTCKVDEGAMGGCFKQEPAAVLKREEEHDTEIKVNITTSSVC